MNEIPIGRFGYVKRQVIDWVTTHVVLTFSGSLGVILLLVGLSQLLHRSQGEWSTDYNAAQIAFEQWKEDEKGFKKLERLIKKHPALHEKYDAQIVQRLLGTGAKGAAGAYASLVFKRIEDFSPHYKQFSATSLLVGEEKWGEALTAAKELKEKMEKDTPFWEQGSQIVRHGSILYGYNLLRIALLEGKAGSPSTELKAWKTLKPYLEGSAKTSFPPAYDTEAYTLIQENFNKGGLPLLDYISYRERQLQNCP